jgi:hypothetical protein
MDSSSSAFPSFLSSLMMRFNPTRCRYLIFGEKVSLFISGLHNRNSSWYRCSYLDFSESVGNLRRSLSSSIGFVGFLVVITCESFGVSKFRTTSHSSDRISAPDALSPQVDFCHPFFEAPKLEISNRLDTRSANCTL